MISGFLRRILTSNITERLETKMVKDLLLDGQLVWVDCEMTGLDVEKCRLVEIACIITDSQLKVIDEFGPIAIKQSPEVLEEMSEWCKVTFKENGLLNRIKESEICEKEAEDKVVKFLKCHTKAGACPIAGNSVHMDRQFLTKYMPKITDHLSYRIVDVSTIKELVKRWYPKEEVEKVPKKMCNHLALDDIRESINELKYYKENFFRL